MLPAYKKLLLPSLVLPEPSKDLAALAAGFVSDIALLMNRLGDVRVSPPGPGPPQPRLLPPAPDHAPER